MSTGPRRVVTGLDAEGRSAIIIDDKRPIDYPGVQKMWHTLTSPADNSGIVDVAAGPFDPSIMRGKEGSHFLVVHMKPGEELLPPGMHASDTIDYVVVLKGRIEFITETSKIELNAGDILVDRGVVHGWRALGDEPGMTAVVIVPAKPVGKGGNM